MIRCIVCDEEQAALLGAAAAMAEAALQARKGRADPDGVLGKSLEMSRIKTHGLLAQLDGPGLAEWEDFSASDWQEIIKLAGVLCREIPIAQKSVVWKSLQAFVLRRGARLTETYGERARKDGSLSGYPVATVEGISPEDQAALRKMRAEHRD